MTPAQLDALVHAQEQRLSIETGLTVEQLRVMAEGRMPTTPADMDRLHALLDEKRREAREVKESG